MRNCLASLERHARAAPVVVYDDGSDDPPTLGVLDETKYRVFRQERKDSNASAKTGGLARNMNAALRLAADEGFEHLWIVQDDMQFVRRIDDQFLSDCATTFAVRPDIVQIRPEFMKSPLVANHGPSTWSPDPKARCYLPTGGPSGLQDTGIVKVESLMEAGFVFSPSEEANFAAGRERGWTRAFCWNPVIMFLPWPNTDRRYFAAPRRVLHHAIERFFRAGVHPIQDMTEIAIEGLKNRAPEQFPYAETYLCTFPGDTVHRPWWYERASAYPERHLRHCLNTIRRSFTRILGDA